jgi:hypothetical protein
MIVAAMVAVGVVRATIDIHGRAGWRGDGADQCGGGEKGEKIFHGRAPGMRFESDRAAPLPMRSLIWINAKRFGRGADVAPGQTA